MRKLSYFFIVTLVLSACKVSTDNEQQATLDSEEVVDPVVIEFDESQGEASTEKNFYFLFDVSGSMSEICDGSPKIDGAKQAINTFLEKVPEDINIGLLLFGVRSDEYGIKEVVPLGANNKEKFRKEISDVYPDGGTPLSNAVYYGTYQLVERYKQQLGYGEYRLIIITDGMASYPDKFAETLRDNGKYPFIAIYGIGLCMDANHILKSYALKYTDADNYSELGKALEETVAELEDFDPTTFNPEDLIMETE
jgi:uncharacterized protein with von Willebrand factor type A (vWA) domain